jgi:hypothetical protein
MISYRSPILPGKKKTNISSLEPLGDRNQLIKRLRLSTLAKITSAIEAIKINAMSLEKRGNRLMWIKRRQPGSGVIPVCQPFLPAGWSTNPSLDQSQKVAILGGYLFPAVTRPDASGLS